MYCTAAYSSPVGELTLAGEDDSLTGLWIAGQKYFGASLPEGPALRKELPVFGQVRQWLDRYFAGERPSGRELPLAPAGGLFRREVWDILLEIPYGTLVTYGDIGKELAARRGAASMLGQAVGGAVSHNPISIIIPCHRVVGKNGSLTGYAGGLDKKIWLLEHEGADISRLSRPKRGTAL